METKVEPEVKYICPNKSCGKPLRYCSGEESIPSHFYCPDCMDYAYNEDMEVIAPLVS